jgi:hypothetical protein
MSKHMQLTVTIRPYYQRDLEGAYPGLDRHLRHLDPVLAKSNPSLFDLVGQLDQVLSRFEGTQFEQVFSRHREKLRDLHKRIKEHIADWKLAQADRLLYEMEDVFDEMETGFH